MRIFDVLRLSVLNLYRRLSRTLLTVIGVIIGTACIVIMVSIGLTNLAQFDEMLDDTDLNKIEIYSDYSDNVNSIKLNDIAVQAFLNIDGVESVIPQKRLNFYCEVNEYYAPYFNIIAIPPEALVDMIELDEGVMINPNSQMLQMVMGLGVARYFIQNDDDYSRDYEGPSLDWLSTSIDMYLGGKYVIQDDDMPLPRKYVSNVVGIIKDINENYSSHDVYISLDMANKILQENYKLANKLKIKANEFDNVIIYTTSMDNVVDILDIVRSYGFEAHSNTEWIDEMQRQQRAQQAQLLAIGLISLIVSAIGIANTMMTGIIERKKEIGVMKVIGVSIGKIRTMFLFEAALIGAIGGVIGVLIAHIFGYIVVSGGEEMNFLGMYFQAGMKFIIPIWLDLGAIAIAMIVGVVAGFFPARSATMMSPLEAVRG